MDRFILSNYSSSDDEFTIDENKFLSDEESEFLLEDEKEKLSWNDFETNKDVIKNTNFQIQNQGPQLHSVNEKLETPLDFFLLIFPMDLIDTIIKFTNKNGDRKIDNNKQKK